MARFSTLAAAALVAATQLADARQTPEATGPVTQDTIAVSFVPCTESVQSSKGDVCVEIDLLDTVPVSGYQFEIVVDGKPSAIKAVGEAPYEFALSAGSQNVLGISFTGARIEAGDHELALVNMGPISPSSQVCLKNVIIAGTDATEQTDLSRTFCTEEASSSNN
uniref:Uncharacterized protein n=1 Tax=Minchinia chitonis TaxID=262233 RepID=A0A7S0P5Y1_9EUKA|mmetsp:Transcript_12819/g.46880  ORF Transcript_12819/g.46880 Transcript_12819/m.46880 type:complete len:165 (-) Transcript_12819:128-622(-)